MRLFRRRQSEPNTEQRRLIDIQPSATSARNAIADTEQQTIADSRYQTVQAVPAVVLSHSPKSHKKGQLVK